MDRCSGVDDAMRDVDSHISPTSLRSIDAYQEENKLKNQKLQVLKVLPRRARRCDSDTASSTTSLRVVTPSITQEAAKLRSSGTSTPISRQFRHTLQLHADAEEALQADNAAYSPNDSCNTSGGTARGDSPPVHGATQTDCYNLYDRLNLPSTRRNARRDSLSQHCKYPIDNVDNVNVTSSLGGSANTTAQSHASPAISCCSSSVCVHCPDSEAKLAAARNAVVDLLSRLTQATEERDDAVETAQREWQLAEILRRKLIEHPDRHVSRLAASGGRLPAHLRSSRIGHVSPDTSPQKPPLPNRYGSPASPQMSPSLRASGYSRTSSRRLSYDARTSAFGNNSVSCSASSSRQRAFTCNEFPSAHSVLLPRARVLPGTPYDSLPFSHQLSAHQQRHMSQQPPLQAHTPTTTPSVACSRAVLRRKLHFPPEASSLMASVTNSWIHSPKRPRANSSPGRESTDTAFQSVSTPRLSLAAALPEERARSQCDAKIKAADLEQQLHQADTVILQLLASQSRDLPRDSSSPLPAAGFSMAQLLRRLQQVEGQSGSSGNSTTSSRFPNITPPATIGRGNGVTKSQRQCHGTAALEAMYSAERTLRALREACGAAPSSELSPCPLQIGSLSSRHPPATSQRASPQHNSSYSSSSSGSNTKNSCGKSSTRFQSISGRYPACSSPEAAILLSSSHVGNRLTCETALHAAVEDFATAASGLEELKQCTSAMESPGPSRYRD